MCGIGGFVDYERDARRGRPILHGMKRTLTPRGPDAEGTYFDEDTALIHRRLIVIDPEGGKQPMCSPDRNTILIYNGELYNTPKLRTELMSRGTSLSDIRTPKCCCTPILSGKPTHFRG